MKEKNITLGPFLSIRTGSSPNGTRPASEIENRLFYFKHEKCCGVEQIDRMCKPRTLA